jgi:hypothetical protein
MREGAVDESFVAIVRGPSTRYPRGFPLLFPVWLAVVVAAAWISWLRVIGPMQWWYRDALVVGMLIAGATVVGVVATIRQPAFRADRHGIRLGLRTERKRPRHRQAHLWWSDVRQLRVEPRRYGALVEISLGPAARIVRRRGPIRQTLLWCVMLVMPFGLGRGTPRLTEPGRKDPQYRIRLYDVTPDELGLALAELALPAVEIIVISRRYGPILARRPQPAAPRRPAPAAPAAPAPPPAPFPAAPAVTPIRQQPAAAPAAPAPAAAAEPAVALTPPDATDPAVAAPGPADPSSPADEGLAEPALADPSPAAEPDPAIPRPADPSPPADEVLAASVSPAGDTPAAPVTAEAALADPPPADAADPPPADRRPREAGQQVPLIVTAPADEADEAPAEREASQPAA